MDAFIILQHVKRQKQPPPRQHTRALTKQQLLRTTRNPSIRWPLSSKWPTTFIPFCSNNFNSSIWRSTSASPTPPITITFQSNELIFSRSFDDSPPTVGLQYSWSRSAPKGSDNCHIISLTARENWDHSPISSHWCDMWECFTASALCFSKSICRYLFVDSCTSRSPVSGCKNKCGRLQGQQ